jgi:hypothetical protein
MSKEKHGKGKKAFYTNTEYWECACVVNYVHKKTTRLRCITCGTREDEQPDARVRDIPRHVHK